MTFVGTAEYVSPEVLGDKPAEFGSDIWAFGVTLFYLMFKELENKYLPRSKPKLPLTVKLDHFFG